jgi:predicted membrane chloride channel (bestrophin family)
MTLMISYLVISKVNLAYERYMEARRMIGHALAALRELNQLLVVYTQSHGEIAKLWRQDMTNRIIDLIDCTVRVIRVSCLCLYYLLCCFPLQWYEM